MFAKLLKHEWRATRGVIGLLCVIILIAGLTIGGVMCRILTADEVVMELNENTVASETAMSDMEEVICVLLIIAGVMAVAVCGAGSVFVVVYRFFKRCFTDEGYLTFTLPVNQHQILLSSFLNSVFGVFLVVLACFGAVMLAGGMFLLALNSTQEILWADVWLSWQDVWQQLVDSFRKNIGQFALLGFSGLVSALSDLMLLMLAVTIGALVAKKHKILAAVGVYYGIGMVQSFAYSMIVFSTATTQEVNLLLAMPGIVGLALAVGGYFGMHWLITKKLNLA